MSQQAGWSWSGRVKRAGPQVTIAVSFGLSARELELEDRQSRLQQELRERMAVEGKQRAGGWAGDTGPLPQATHLMPSAPGRSPEDGGGAFRGEEDPERDAGGGGAERLAGGPAGRAAAAGKRGGQGPGGRHAVQGLQPGLVLSLANVALGRLAPTWPGCGLPNRWIQAQKRPGIPGRVVLRHLCCRETPGEGYPLRLTPPPRREPPSRLPTQEGVRGCA